MDKQTITNRIREIINAEQDYDREKKASMQGRIDRADKIYQVVLLVFGLGFWVVMILKMFLH